MLLVRARKSQNVKGAVLFIDSDTCLDWFFTCVVLMFQILLSVIENYPITCWCKDQAFWSIIFWIALFFAIYRNNQTLLSIAMTQNPLARIVFLWHTVKTLQLYMSSGIATQGWQKCSLAYILMLIIYIYIYIYTHIYTYIYTFLQVWHKFSYIL